MSDFDIHCDRWSTDILPVFIMYFLFSQRFIHDTCHSILLHHCHWPQVQAREIQSSRFEQSSVCILWHHILDLTPWDWQLVFCFGVFIPKTYCSIMPKSLSNKLSDFKTFTNCQHWVSKHASMSNTNTCSTLYFDWNSASLILLLLVALVKVYYIH